MADAETPYDDPEDIPELEDERLARRTAYLRGVAETLGSPELVALLAAGQSMADTIGFGDGRGTARRHWLRMLAAFEAK